MGVLIIFGTVVSYIPQYVNLYRQRTSLGISYLALCFGLLSGFFTIIDTVILYWPRLLCCRSLTPGQCFDNNLVPWQVISGPLCVFALYIQYLYTLSRYDVPEDPERMLRQYLFALVSFGVVLLLTTVLSTIALLFHFSDIAPPGTLSTYARVVGTLSAVVVFLHWTPQVVTTFRLSAAGALSILMLIIQCPGAFLVVGFQVTSKNPDWSTWAPMLVAGGEQLVLIVMLAYFHWRDRHKTNISLIQKEEQVTLLPTEDPKVN
uniref:Uncharacterized protein n=1 Tax=Arcella intermedia TaxID=1963864 RepID=A0A6B2LDQ5_9EUKA